MNLRQAYYATIMLLVGVTMFSDGIEGVFEAVLGDMKPDRITLAVLLLVAGTEMTLRAMVRFMSDAVDAARKDS